MNDDVRALKKVLLENPADWAVHLVLADAYQDAGWTDLSAIHGGIGRKGGVGLSRREFAVLLNSPSYYSLCRSGTEMRLDLAAVSLKRTVHRVAPTGLRSPRFVAWTEVHYPYCSDIHPLNWEEVLKADTPKEITALLVRRFYRESGGRSHVARLRDDGLPTRVDILVGEELVATYR